MAVGVLRVLREVRVRGDAEEDVTTGGGGGALCGTSATPGGDSLRGFFFFFTSFTEDARTVGELLRFVGDPVRTTLRPTAI